MVRHSRPELLFHRIRKIDQRPGELPIAFPIISGGQYPTSKGLRDMCRRTSSVFVERELVAGYLRLGRLSDAYGIVG